MSVTHLMVLRAAVLANSRNGYYPKTVRTDIGDVTIDVPRDRNGAFDPVTVPIGSRRLSGFDDLVVSLYAKGLTTGDIRRTSKRSMAPRSTGQRSAGRQTRPVS